MAIVKFHLNNPTHKELSYHYCGYRGHIQPDCQKKGRNNATKPTSTNHKPTPRSNIRDTTKETLLLGINTNSSSMINDNTSFLDDLIVGLSNYTCHMTNEEST